MINWHRLFGIALMDFFRGSPYEVELEKDLSVKRQLLDIVIVRRTGDRWEQPLPDGLENLADHNLMSYKSLQEPFDDWTLKELTGYYVNYRKQISPTLNNLLPEEAFRLYGICTRFPQKLKGQIQLEEIMAGVYDIQRGTDRIRLIVLSEIEDVSRNWIWELFSNDPNRVRSAAQEIQTRHREASTMLNQVLRWYQQEGMDMPYTMEDFKRDVKEQLLKELTPEERLKGLPPEERLKGLPPEERLKGLPAEERLKDLSSDEVLKHFKIEEIEAYLDKLRRQTESESSDQS